MKQTPIWLYDRWYGLAARERLRQLALWAPEPVLVYRNCGLPFGSEKEIEQEVRLFQKEGIVKLWQYEGEKSYPDSIAPLSVGSPFTINQQDYQGIIRYVDTRLEDSYADPKALGFQSMEGMLLEQVVLRRRFYAQAISGALKANTLADSSEHSQLYKTHEEIISQVSDTLIQFFKTISVPSLVLMDNESFLQLRQKSQQVLPEIAADVYTHLMNSGKSSEQANRDEVVRLTNIYETELLKLIKKQRAKSAKNALLAFDEGTRTQIESKLALFYLNDPISDLTPWFSQDTNGYCRLSLLLLEWKAGKFSTDFQRIK